MQHGLERDRSDALALANELGAVGYAVLSCDAPLHGSRGPAGDEVNRFTGESAPDGFGDGFGDLLGADSRAGALGALHPFYYRDAFRQSVVEWMAIVHALTAGGWDAAVAGALQDAGPLLSRADFGFVGVDLGAEVGIALGAVEPAIGAYVLAFPGGLGPDDWLSSPGFLPFVTAIEERLETSDLVSAADRATRPDLDVLRSLWDRGTGGAYASRMRRNAANVLMTLTMDDEHAPNESTEALAHAVGSGLLQSQRWFRSVFF
jgi:hypothetical protein